MRSYFVTGTDTGVGKTLFAAGLARAASDAGADIGVMKPFAAGEAQKSGFRSADAQMLAQAARADDDESLVNPQFFDIPAAPFTAARETGVDADIELVKRQYDILASRHDCMLVEGIGGVMVPVTDRYYVADLARDLGLEVIIVAANRIGSVNHAVMTAMACRDLPVRGLVINCIDRGGYPGRQMRRDLESLLDIEVLGVVQRVEQSAIDEMARTIAGALDMDSL